MNPPSKPDGSLIFVDKGGKLTSPSLQMLQGFWQIIVGGTFEAYTPTVFSGTGMLTTLGTIVARSCQINKIIYVALDISITTNGTGATNVASTLPTTNAGSATLIGQEINATGKAVVGRIVASNAGFVTLTFDDFTYPGGSGYRIIASGCYETQ